MTDDDCGCGVDHAPHQPCEHASTEVTDCHNMTLLACPHHFTSLSSDTLSAALPRNMAHGGLRHFADLVGHINGDGYMGAAYFTWMHVLGRWGVEPGEDRQAALGRLRPAPQPPEGLPSYVGPVRNLVEMGSRAAITYDGETVEAVLAAADKSLDAVGLMSFMASICASAHITAETNAACTTETLFTTHLFGSQVNGAAAFSSLPYLVDMTQACRVHDGPAAGKAMKGLLELPGNAELVAAVDLCARVIAQIAAKDMMVIVGTGGAMDGMLDWRLGPLASVEEALRPSVLALRTADLYHSASPRNTVTRGMQALAEEVGSATDYVVDTLMGATQLISDMLSSSKIGPPPDLDSAG